MRLSRTDLVPVVTIIAGGVVGALLTLSPRVLRAPSYDVPAYVRLACDQGSAPLGSRMIRSRSGLVAHYPLDGNTDDVSGNNLDGHACGAVPTSVRNGAVGRAYRVENFDYISLDARAFDGLRDFTVSFWVLFDSFNEGFDNYNTILSVASQNKDNELLIGYASSKLGFDVFANQFFIGIDTEFGGDPDLRPFDANTVVKDGEWHSVTIVRRGSTATLYIDGSQAGGAIVVPSNAIRTIGNGAILGQEQDAVATRFKIGQNLSGRIDDVYVHDRSLSASEVQTLYSVSSR